MRTITWALLLGALSQAGEPPQVEWARAWDAAFEKARATRRPLMVCINSKDGESANEFAAGRLYRDPRFVAASRKFVMLVVSTIEHAATGPCPRFGKVTCREHLECWKELNAAFGPQFAVEGRAGEMISPQHAWFSPDGRLLRRKEYALARQQLLKQMRAVLAEEDHGAPKAPAERGTLTDADRAEIARLDAPEQEIRAAALANLLSAGRPAVHDALLAMLGAARSRGEIVGALAATGVEGARAAAEKLLADPDPLVRSAAAVALEDLGEKESIPALTRRARNEKDECVRRNVCRALGVCGGAAGDKGALKTLLDVAVRDRQGVVRRHAALALKGYEGEHAALARRKVEQLALAEKDPDVRRAFVYVLGYLGDPKTTVPVLEKILAAEESEHGASFVRGAIVKVRGPASAGGEDRFGDSARWLFAEDRDDPAR